MGKGGPGFTESFKKLTLTQTNKNLKENNQTTTKKRFCLFGNKLFIMIFKALNLARIKSLQLSSVIFLLVHWLFILRKCIGISVSFFIFDFVSVAVLSLSFV